MARILVVDDDGAIRGAIRRLLIIEGYEVIEAINGREAIAFYREQPVDLVITDIWMPDKDGLEVIRELRQISPDLPMIAMSGRSSRGQVDFLHHAEAFGACQVLQKPFKIEDLVQSVRKFLDEGASLGVK
ncbi:MAG: CheY-like chemotaxis protein [Candidatus Latescibacterota bacterium]